RVVPPYLSEPVQPEKGDVSYDQEGPLRAKHLQALPDRIGLVGEPGTSLCSQRDIPATTRIKIISIGYRETFSVVPVQKEVGSPAGGRDARSHGTRQHRPGGNAPIPRESLQVELG